MALGRLGLAHRPAGPVLHLTPPRPQLSRVAWGPSSQACPPPRLTRDGSGHRLCRRAIRAAFLILTKGRCCVFKLHYLLLSLSVFIYLLLVLKTKIVSSLVPLKQEGRWRSCVCRGRIRWSLGRVCLCVGYGVCELTECSVCHVLCVCRTRVLCGVCGHTGVGSHVACVLYRWGYKLLCPAPWQW